MSMKKETRYSLLTFSIALVVISAVGLTDILSTPGPKIFNAAVMLAAIATIFYVVTRKGNE